jgi:peptidoglycan/xylan/chitin deacetylase (PgdA/CDA1 family)
MRQYARAARHEPWIEPPIHPQGNSSPFLFTPIHAPNEPPSIRIVPIDIPMTPRPRKLKILRWLPSSLVTTTGARAGGNLYLTFDDGPDAEHTAPLLELLARHQAKASFFLIGRQIEAHPELARRIAGEGHTLGNHSFTHPHFEKLGLSAQLDEIDRTDALLSGIDGRPRHSFRPPRGVMPPRMLANFFRRRRRAAYWSYDSLDYSRRPAAELIEIIRRHPVQAGDVLLMHDDSALSLEMLTVLIPEWKAQGFNLQALPAEA